jgi:hypothetical protein
LFRPKYVSLAREFQQEYPQVEFYAVSCVAHQDICQRYKVDAYPSLFTMNVGTTEAILLKPGKLSVATLKEAFGLNKNNDHADALPMAAGGAARNRNSAAAAARESRDLEGQQDEENIQEGLVRQRRQPDDDNVGKANSNDPNNADDENDDEDEENTNGGSLGGFQDSANEMLRKIGTAAKKEFLDPFLANQPQDEPDMEDEDDTDDTVPGNNDYSNKGNANSRNRHADYEEDEEDGDNRGKYSPTARTKNLDEEDDEDDEAKAFEALANAAGLTVRENVVDGQKPGAALALQRRGDMLPLRTKEGLRTSVLKRKGETARRGGTVFHSLTNNRNNNRHNKFAPDAPKPGLRPEDKPAPAGETDTMKAHRKGTQEFEDRKTMILAEIERVKGLKVRQEVEKKWVEIMRAQGEKGRAPYKKVVAKPRLVERLPIVKRLVTKMGEEEALMLDTSLAFLSGLRMGVFNKDEPGPLTQRKKETLTDWLDLMSIALPQEWGLQTAIDDLRDNIELISKDQSSLERILFRHKLQRATYSDSCAPKKDDIGISGGGFTCGFWKLLHTMTIGIAEHRGGQVSGSRPTTMRLLHSSRTPLSHFFLYILLAIADAD